MKFCIIDWNAVSAIGTVAAALVGIAGIWLNLHDKRKKLKILFETSPSYKVFICNSSLRTVMITRIRYYAGNHIFFVEAFEGLSEMSIPPATTHTYLLDKTAIHISFCDKQMSLVCDKKDEIILELVDNFGRVYKLKTGLTVETFET